MKKKNIIIGSVIAVLAIAVLVESILLAVGYFSRTPKLANGQDKVVSLGTGTEYSVDQVYDMVKDSYALQKILDKVDEELLGNKYKDNEEVNLYVETKLATAHSNYPEEADFEKYLSYFNCNNEDEYKAYLKVEKQKELITTEYAKSQVTDKEVKKYYKEDYVGDIAARHILVRPKDNDTTTARKTSQEILDKIDSLVSEGKSVSDAFDAVTEEYKDNEQVKAEDLGYFNKGAMVEAFETAAFNLKVGEYSSSPVNTSYGYHVIYVYDQKEKEKLEDVKDKLVEQIAKNKVDEDKTKLQTKALVNLRKENNFEIYDASLNKQYERYINYMLNSK